MSSIRLNPERMVFHLVAVAAEVHDWNDSPHSPVYVISTCWMEILVPKAQHRFPFRSVLFNRASQT